MEEFEVAFGRALAAGGGEAEVDGAASVLAASGDAWSGIAGRLAARVGRECAGRGWGSADLLRMAERELGARHRRAAVALAEGGDGLADFAGRERLDRFSAAGLAVEVLCLYGRLPRIAALTPPRPASASGPAAGAAGKALGRIRALLAKAESTGFPEEAEALSAKAQHLMARHSIDEALVAGGGAGGPGPGARRIGVDRPYEGAKALLLDAVASANRCQAVWSADFGFSTVVGHDTDLDAVELLYTSLLVQADRALRRGASRSRDFRESFLIAYAARIGERLSAAVTAEVGDSAAPDLLPVLASRDLAVESETRRLFPSTTTSRLKGRDREGWHHGHSAADAATFGPR
ncbi:DUF2786 domain-containing protein [Actinacidiphila sp. ITFR-21]|uniref:DUF2786 domain-containing protein n=1 Tax=Actinacidiphila sp. ITFR-21 TaxID=3075199 RepID=UPI00288BFEF4|nr:DUF2786 domain-containing protein [Streptomyces sp. ITFR-21]WNI16086.1 DUF2786 domain-containing protein [Streptomyces sp. ITFR-21]